jgi:hypothetical protein
MKMGRRPRCWSVTNRCKRNGVSIVQNLVLAANLKAHHLESDFGKLYEAFRAKLHTKT